MSTYPEALNRLARLSKGPCCPLDGKGMNEYDLDGVVIDVCPICKGTWFDCTEYAKMMDLMDKTDDNRINWLVVFLHILL
jgi:hypothetical protein